MKLSLTMRWSEAGCLSQFVLSHALRQASVSLILGVRHKETISPEIQAERRRRFSNPISLPIY